MKLDWVVILRLAFALLLVFALVVATGTAFVTGWNVWLCGALLAFDVERLFFPNRPVTA